MAAGIIAILGSDVFCSIADGGREARLPLADAAPLLAGWAARYDRACGRDDEGALAAIGREMFAWLDGAGWASAWADALGDDRTLEIRVGAKLGADEPAPLDAPWELLARGDGPLALDALQLFVVSRRVGAPAAPRAPRHADLQLMFMAAAPQGQHELDFEAEEAAILEATERLPLRLVVEETGNRTFLGERLNADEGPFEALHLSCHGDIDPKAGPVLLLETAEGGADKAGPGELVAALGADPPELVFLSACRTAEFGRAAGAPSGCARPPPRERKGPPRRLALGGETRDETEIFFQHLMKRPRPGAPALNSANAGRRLKAARSPLPPAPPPWPRVAAPARRRPKFQPYFCMAQN